MNKTATAVELRKDAAALLREVKVGGERTEITRSGKAVAYLVPIEDAAFLEAVEDRADGEAALEAQRRIDSGEEEIFSVESVGDELGFGPSKDRAAG
jgi:prevent-host-death family protein